MTANEVIRTIMRTKGYTQEKLAGVLGYKNQSGVRQRLVGNMRVDILVKFLAPLECELVIRSTEDGKEWVIDKGLED